MADNPVSRGFKVYSQTDEDGIIEDILSRIRCNLTFVEIGCGNGLENNTHYLLLKGYTGCWVDGSGDNLNFIIKHLDSSIDASSKLKLIEQLVDLNNIEHLITTVSNYINTKEPDLFSLDIDGNDLFILEESLKYFNPKVICVEYNAKFPPPLRLSMTYDGLHSWTGNDYQGATLQMLCDRLTDYRLVCCNLSGANAFFVRKDLADPFEPYSVEQLYQPCRFDLCKLSSGHAPSLNWLNDVLANDAIPLQGSQNGHFDGGSSRSIRAEGIAGVTSAEAAGVSLAAAFDRSSTGSMGG